MERAARLAKLRKIIESEQTGSQEVLLKILQKSGFEVTQATLSRDLKYLKVGKVPDGKGAYLYTFSNSADKGGSDRSLVEDFIRGFISIEFSGSQGIVTTLPGHADSVAFALDNLNIREILGTIAGDDTILVIPRDRVKRDTLIKALIEHIPGIEENMG